MQIDVQTKSRSLLGVSDLTLVAPIKRGLIPALDARSYASRARLLMRTLNTLRISSREAQLTPLIADTVDRIRQLQSFRLAIVEDLQPKLLLSVAFDGGWEPYMRRIWRDLGPLLDVIFCNCEGYPLAQENDFATYANWVRSAQVTTEFFYNASSLTVNDLHYLRAQAVGRLTPPDAAAKAAAAAAALSAGTTKRDAVVSQSLAPLNALYRASDMYPPFNGDGACLLRAADYLLRELSDALLADPAYADKLEQDPQLAPSERAAVKWFRGATRPIRQAAALQRWSPAAVQGGVLESSEGVTHACLLLLELKSAAAAEALLEHAESSNVSEADQRRKVSELFNIFFTPQGLRAAGVAEATLELMPFEFREGMAARAGILGDYLHNHPTRWHLPVRNWPAPGASAEPIELSSVHAVVQLAVRATQGLAWHGMPDPKGKHPLSQCLVAFDAKLGTRGVRVLSVQPMQRYIPQDEVFPRGHFGYSDGLSQPMPQPSHQQPWERVALGDFLLGYPNSRDDPPQTGRLWNDSTFLVVRKLRQDVKAFNDALPQAEPEALHAKAQLVGRSVDGVSLVSRRNDNAFDYAGTDGDRCPVHAHVRRANPRTTNADEPPVPRIIRRGMSYGPLPDEGNADEDRGLMFMAYNASIAEQFEVIQSWLSGGNSERERSFSGQRDPLLGVANQGDPTGIEYADAGGTRKLLKIDPDRPFVSLEWGLYLFVPSISAIGELKAIAREAVRMESDEPKKEDRRKLLTAIDAQKGAVAIARLKMAEQALGLAVARDQWKIALEDVSARMSGVSKWIWAAVRQLHGGVLRTPYGVLVCSREKVKEVFDNRIGNYTVTGYAERMAKSFGAIYLGMDEGAQYQLESRRANQAIQDISRADAFKSAFERTRLTLTQQAGADAATAKTVEAKDLVDAMLAGLCDEWFGLPDNILVEAGGWHWRDQGPPTCPGHFHSPSRYMFQPNPGKETSDIGQAHGKALNKAVREWVSWHRRRGTVPLRTLAERLFEAIPDDDERLTRTLIGVLMGFLPTVDGNLRATLYEWVNDRSLWDHQIAYRDAVGTPFEKAREVLWPPLVRALQLRPVPELTWRIALRNHTLGPVEVRAGETVVISIVSAMQECLANEDTDIYAVFGGERDRGAQTSTPTHACPGYEMALGVMLGFLAALVEFAQMRPTLSPMALKMSLLTR